MLLARSVCELQRMLTACEHEISWLDLLINSEKSCCIRSGPRCNTECINLTTSCGFDLPWVTDIKYLGVHIVHSRIFKCSFLRAKKDFRRSLRSLNAVHGRVGRFASEEVLGRVGRFASEEVLIKLVTSKCLPILLHGAEACPLFKSDVHSLDFVNNCFVMEFCETNSMLIII
jgi:hypothetical protein